METYSKNKLDLVDIKSDKVKIIATSPLLSLKLKAFILLQSNDILGIFNLTKEELDEFKTNFFSVDNLIRLGKPYILDYLERSGQRDLLKFYLNGEEYTKAKVGFSDKIDAKEIYTKLVNKTLIDSYDSDDIALRLKCLNTIKIDVKSDSSIDKLAKLLESVDI